MTDTEQYTRRKHLAELVETYHSSKYGDYEDAYEEFAATYLGSPEMEEDYLVRTYPVPKYASVASDETYGMIELCETLEKALTNQAGIPGNGEYLNVPAGIYDLDTGKVVWTRTVMLTEDMYATLCGLVAGEEGADVLDGGEAVTHAGIFGPFEELRKVFPLDDFRLWARQHDLDAGDEVGYIPPLRRVMAKRKQGNPAKQGWDPITVGPARREGAFGMTKAFYDSNGRKHWYSYREPQRATAVLAFYNRLYNGFALVFEDTSMHLSFKRNDRAAVRDWRHFQAIKNEVAGPEREAIEIFPPESELVDAANEYHLWVLPDGSWSPLGFVNGEPLLLDEVDNMDYARYRQGGPAGSRQRGWEENIPTGLGRQDDTDDT